MTVRVRVAQPKDPSAAVMSFHSPTTSYGDMDGFHNGTAGIGKRVTLFANGSFVDGKGGSSPTWRVRQPRQPFLFLQRVWGMALPPSLFSGALVCAPRARQCYLWTLSGHCKTSCKRVASAWAAVSCVCSPRTVRRRGVGVVVKLQYSPAVRRRSCFAADGDVRPVSVRLGAIRRKRCRRR